MKKLVTYKTKITSAVKSVRLLRLLSSRLPHRLWFVGGDDVIC